MALDCGQHHLDNLAQNLPGPTRGDTPGCKRFWCCADIHAGGIRAAGLLPLALAEQHQTHAVIEQTRVSAGTVNDMNKSLDIGRKSIFTCIRTWGIHLNRKLGRESP